MEEPEFYFAEDGSFFKMSVRTTAMKRKVHIGLPVIGFLSVLKAEKDFRSTLDYKVIDFDNELNQVTAMTPKFTPGDSWIASCSADGSFIASTFDTQTGQCQVSIYLASDPNPLKTIKFNIPMKSGSSISGFKFAPSKDPLLNYVAMINTDVSKKPALTVAALNFKDGTSKVITEVFDRDHLKQMEKNFIPVSKKFDKLKFNGYFDIDHIKEYGQRLIVGISNSYRSATSGGGSYTMDETVTLNTFSKDLKLIGQQFLPRSFLSLGGEGSEIAYHQHGDHIKLIANQKDGGAVETMYAELKIETGQLSNLKILPKDDIKNRYYVKTSSISWLDNGFIIPYFERKGMLGNSIDLQYQSLSY